MNTDLYNYGVRYKAPWAQEPLHKRLMEVNVEAKCRVAYLYEVPDTSTFRYRVYNIIEALRAWDKKEVAASWFCMAEIDALTALLRKLHVLVIVRVRYSRALGELVSLAQAFGVRVLADFDDLVFDTRYAHLVMANNDGLTHDEASVNEWFAYVGRLQATAELCSGGTTTNPFLAEKLAAVCNGPVRVVPNFLNRRQEEFSRCLLAEKQANGFRGQGPLKIGYFSGSPTHNNDFRIVIPALQDIMDHDSQVSLRIVGYMESFRELSRFGDRVEQIELQNWISLQARIAEVDINIAPLQLNDFTNCKSELKYFEAAVVGTFSCLSRSYTFENAVESPHHSTVLANWQWGDALRSAIELARTPAKYGERVSAAAESAYARYGWDRSTGAILSALGL